VARAPALGLLLAGSTMGFVRLVGADPGALTWGVSLPLLGLALATPLAARLPARVGSALALVGLASLAAPTGPGEGAATLARALHLSHSQGLSLLLALWVSACTAALLPFARRTPRGPGPLLAGAVTALLGLWLPPWLSLAAVGLVAVALAWSPGRPSPALPGPSSALGWVAISLLGAWSVGFVWSGLRAWLDPTPIGWWLTLYAATSSFALGWWLASLRRRRLGLEPLVVATALLAAAASLPWLAPRLAPALPELLIGSSPRLLLPGLLATTPAVLGALFGLATPAREDADAAPWLLASSAAAGLVLAVQGGLLGTLLLPLAGVCGGLLALLIAKAPIRRLAGLGGALLLGLGWWQLPHVQLTPLTTGFLEALDDEATLQRHLAALARSEWEHAGWGPEGSSGVRHVGEVMVVDIDGTPLWATGRDLAAVRFAAHIPPLLARTPERFLVLGDALGWGSVSLLAHGPDGIQISVAQPELLRVLARRDKNFERALLAPEVQLRPVPGAWLLRQSAPVDGILQISSKSWADSGGVPPDASFFRLVRRRLGPGGVYAAVVSTDASPSGEVVRTLQDFASVFPRGVACLPPSGADHLLLVAAPDDGLSLGRLVERFPAAAAALGTVGVTDPLDLADRCVFSASSLAATDARASTARTPPFSLPPSLGSPPTVFLAGLQERVAAPGTLWEVDGEEEQILGKLQARFDAIEDFLALLGDTTRGDLESLFRRAEALQASGEGADELQTLIAPHLSRARVHMEQARKGGLQHRGWQQAINELTLARMLHPAAVEPRLLEAMVHEARSEHRKAEKLYRGVLTDEPGHLQALFGIARIQILEGREAEAIATLERAVETHPREVAAHQVLGVTLLRFGRYDEAEPVLRRAVALAEPDQAQPQAALAELFLAMGEPTVAIAHAELAVRIEPSAYHYTLLGRCHFELERLVPAERAYRQAVLVDPGFYPPRAGLAHIFTLRGDYRQAADSLQAVLLADPGNDAARANLQEVQRLMDAAQADPRLELEP
jgi:tetratricopeptide (TPR) repeat protein